MASPVEVRVGGARLFLKPAATPLQVDVDSFGAVRVLLAPLPLACTPEEMEAFRHVVPDAHSVPSQRERAGRSRRHDGRYFQSRCPCCMQGGYLATHAHPSPLRRLVRGALLAWRGLVEVSASRKAEQASGGTGCGAASAVGGLAVSILEEKESEQSEKEVSTSGGSGGEDLSYASEAADTGDSVDGSGGATPRSNTSQRRVNVHRAETLAAVECASVSSDGTLQKVDDAPRLDGDWDAFYVGDGVDVECQTGPLAAHDCGCASSDVDGGRDEAAEDAPDTKYSGEDKLYGYEADFGANVVGEVVEGSIHEEVRTSVAEQTVEEWHEVEAEADAGARTSWGTSGNGTDFVRDGLVAALADVLGLERALQGIAMGVDIHTWAALATASRQCRPVKKMSVGAPGSNVRAPSSL